MTIGGRGGWEGGRQTGKSPTKSLSARRVLAGRSEPPLEKIRKTRENKSVLGDRRSLLIIRDQGRPPALFFFPTISLLLLLLRPIRYSRLGNTPLILRIRFRGTGFARDWSSCSLSLSLPRARVRARNRNLSARKIVSCVVERCPLRGGYRRRSDRSSVEGAGARGAVSLIQAEAAYISFRRWRRVIASPFAGRAPLTRDGGVNINRRLILDLRSHTAAFVAAAARVPLRGIIACCLKKRQLPFHSLGAEPATTRRKSRVFRGTIDLILQ